MATPTAALAVTLNELTTLTAGMPVLLGREHPELGTFQDAMRDVSAELFAALQAQASDAPAPADAADVAVQIGRQMSALRALQRMLADAAQPPAHPDILDEGLEMICGLLEISAPPA